MKTEDFLGVGIVFLLILIAMDKRKKFANVTEPLRRRGCDSGGCGTFGAHRSAHPTVPHQGQDFLAPPGSPFYAAISGKVRIAPPYASDPRFSGVEVIGGVYKVKAFYIFPLVKAGDVVEAGDLIGIVQDLSVKYGSGVPNHSHVEVRRYGVVVDPSPYFGKDTATPIV